MGRLDAFSSRHGGCGQRYCTSVLWIERRQAVQSVSRWLRACSQLAHLFPCCPGCCIDHRRTQPGVGAGAPIKVESSRCGLDRAMKLIDCWVRPRASRLRCSTLKPEPRQNHEESTLQALLFAYTRSYTGSSFLIHFSIEGKCRGSGFSVVSYYYYDGKHCGSF